jgi:hypothetical protein
MNQTLPGQCYASDEKSEDQNSDDYIENELTSNYKNSFL